MKELADGTQVTSRSYYYLLDYNDKSGFEFMNNVLNKQKLCELNIKEYTRLFEYAVNDEITAMKIIKGG